mgnify:CR=1 FL=1
MFLELLVSGLSKVMYSTSVLQYSYIGSGLQSTVLRTFGTSCVSPFSVHAPVAVSARALLTITARIVLAIVARAHLVQEVLVIDGGR